MSMVRIINKRQAALTALLFLFVVACIGYLDNASPNKNYTLYLARETVTQQHHEGFLKHSSTQLEILKASQAPELVSLRKQLEKYRSLPESRQIAEVNYFINRSTQYVSHQAHHPQPKGWGEVECVRAHGGDCVDFAQTKYIALRYLGWPADRLQMVIGWSRHSTSKILHAVLLVTQSDQSQLLLDNLYRLPLPPKEAVHFEPLYAYNEQKNFVFDPSRSAEPREAIAAGDGSTAP